MKLIDSLVLIAVILVISLIIARYIYKRKKHMPTGECSCCSSKRNVNNMLKKINKELEDENIFNNK